jgi:hypothetical protein
MIWQETTAELALVHQQALLDEAESQRLAVHLPNTPRYREWLARQLLSLALYLAPSLCSSLAASGQSTIPATLKPSANGGAQARLI